MQTGLRHAGGWLLPLENSPEEKHPAPSEWWGWAPADQVLHAPRALTWRNPFAPLVVSKLVESRLLPCSRQLFMLRTAGLGGGTRQDLSVQHEAIDQVFLQE